MSSTSFSSIGEDTASRMTMKAEVSGTPGSVNLFADVTGQVGANFSDLNKDFDGDEETVLIKVTVTGVEEFASRVRKQVGALDIILGSMPGRFKPNARRALPDKLKNPTSVGGYVTPSVGTRPIGPPRDNATLNRTIEFQPIPFPTFDNFDDPTGRISPEVLNFDPADLPDLGVTFEVVPKRAAFPILNSPPRVDLTLTGRALIEEVPIGTLDCGELFSELKNKVDDISDRMRTVRRTLDEESQELRQKARELENVAGGSKSLQDLNIEDIISLGRSRLESMKGEIEASNPRRNLKWTPSDLRSDLEGLRRRVQDINIPNCRDQIGRTIPRMLETLENMESRLDTIMDRRDELLTVLRDIESPSCTEEFPQLSEEINQLESIRINASMSAAELNSKLQRVDRVENKIRDLPQDAPCRDQFIADVNRVSGDINDLLDRATDRRVSKISQELLNAVASFQQDVRSFLDKDRLARQPDRKSRLIRRGERLRSRIRSSDSLNRGQRSRLLTRVSEPLSELRGAGVRTPEALPCTSRYPDVDEEVDRFRERVVELRPPVSPEELNRIVRRGERVVNMIDSEVTDSSRCRREFTTETRALVQRAQSFTSRVRVETQTAEQAKDQSEKLIEELLGQLNSIGGDRDLEATPTGDNIPSI